MPSFYATYATGVRDLSRQPVCLTSFKRGVLQISYGCVKIHNVQSVFLRLKLLEVKTNQRVYQIKKQKPYSSV